MNHEAPPDCQLLVVDDDEDLRDLLTLRFRKQGAVVHSAASGEDALRLLEEIPICTALVDLRMAGMDGLDLLRAIRERYPSIEVLMMTAHGSIENAIEAMKRGACDFLTKPVNFHELEIRVRKATEKARMRRREQRRLDQLRYESSRYQIIGKSPHVQVTLKLIRKVAATEATVLIRGPSGTGKELVARAIHYNSSRSEQPMVTINCAALQETLLESELFGHEKGSFTGAGASKPGLFEVAEEGTLFIDEIGEMAPGLQAKLLRVLEDGHYRRVGGTREQHANVRLVAATNRDLELEMKEGRFREDLYYRLNVVTIPLAPLSQRREDIGTLVEHFLTTCAVGGAQCSIDPEALQVLLLYDWPGNIRELVNVLERAQILAEDHRITVDDLPENLAESQHELDSDACVDAPLSLRQVERQHVQRILEQEKGNKVRAAKVLGISRRSLYRLMEKHGLDSPGDHEAE